MKYFFYLTCLLCCLHYEALSQETRWTLRLGAVGTGTGDRGIWGFDAVSGLGAQEFVFSNSWGAAFDADYALTSRWLVGLHLAVSRTTFGVDLETNGISEELRDNTSFSPLMAEVMYGFRPDKRWQPYLGLTGGVLFTKDVSFDIGGQSRDFEFANKPIYGLLLGFDWQLGKTLAVHTLIRATTFEYTLLETDISGEQTLLDQNWWQNFNHIQIGLTKNL